MARDMAPEAEAATVSNSETVRERWIAELRRQGTRQCTDLFVCGGQVCALGLLREVSSLDELDDVVTIGALAGLDDDQAWDITYRNDGDAGHYKHTFAEIADVVEGWFK